MSWSLLAVNKYCTHIFVYVKAGILCVYILDLIQKWAAFVREVDPDIITGYNIQNFDLPYLINRALHLKVADFTYMGRIKDAKSVIKESTIQSKQMGKRENKVINIEGRVQLDLLQVNILCHPCYFGSSFAVKPGKSLNDPGC